MQRSLDTNSATRAHVAICSYLVKMTSAGIRELKNNLSRYIRRIEAGERIAITAFGLSLETAIPGDVHKTFRLVSARPYPSGSFHFVTDGIHAALEQAKAAAGSGEPPLAGVDLRALGHECTRHIAGERALHVFITRRR